MSPMPIEFHPNVDDGNLIIANEPTVTDFENTPKSLQEKQNPIKSGQMFPLSLHKLIEASSDSSWGSSSICSSLSDLTEQPKVKFLSLDSTRQHNSISDKNIGEVKSETTLITRPKGIECEDDKTVSLPALEVKDNCKLGMRTSTKVKTTQSVGFSLPEIDMSDKEVDAECSKASENADFNNVFSIVNERDENASPNIEHCSKDFEDSGHSSSSDKQHRQIQRVGAIRMNSRESTTHARLRTRTNSGSPGTSLLRHESDGDEGSSEVKHIAISHEDTSAGAVHCFQDQYGKIMKYISIDLCMILYCILIGYCILYTDWCMILYCILIGYCILYTDWCMILYCILIGYCMLYTDWCMILYCILIGYCILYTDWCMIIYCILIGYCILYTDWCMILYCILIGYCILYTDWCMILYCILIGYCILYTDWCMILYCILIGF